MFDRVGFWLSECWASFRKNGLLSFASVATVAVSMFLIGGLGYAYWRVSAYAETVPSMFDMRVHLKDGTSTDQISETARRIRRIPGVKSAVWLPRDRMWDLERRKNPAIADVPNPLPDALKVVLDDLNSSERVATAIKSLPSVRDDDYGVVYLGNEQRFASDGLRMIRSIGIGAGALLLLAAGLLIFVTVKLTVHARRLELRVMRLVGASGFTIRSPFYVEGLVYGAIGGALACLLLRGVAESASRFLAGFQSFGSLPTFPLGTGLWMLTCTGAAFGLICAIAAVRIPHRFRS